jgi:hypothetical protein
MQTGAHECSDNPQTGFCRKISSECSELSQSGIILVASLECLDLIKAEVQGCLITRQSKE